MLKPTVANIALVPIQMLWRKRRRRRGRPIPDYPDTPIGHALVDFRASFEHHPVMHRFCSEISQFAMLAILILNGCDTQQGVPVTSDAPGDHEGRPSMADPQRSAYA
jgi:hypothetical protein